MGTLEPALGGVFPNPTRPFRPRAASLPTLLSANSTTTDRSAATPNGGLEHPDAKLRYQAELLPSWNHTTALVRKLSAVDKELAAFEAAIEAGTGMSDELKELPALHDFCDSFEQEQVRRLVRVSSVKVHAVKITDNSEGAGLARCVAEIVMPGC